MRDFSAVTQTLTRTKEVLSALMLVLNQKEKYVIERRFNIVDGAKATLEELGAEFKVTRERVRQIEKNALAKLRRNVGNTDLVYINEFAKELIDQNGGVIREKILVAEILNKLALKEEAIDVNSVKLSLHLDTSLCRKSNTICYYPYVRFATITDELISLLADKSIQALKNKGDVMSEDKLIAQVYKQIGRERGNFDPRFIIACLKVHKLCKDLKSGYGLKTWRHVNPRTLRDKIYFVLNQLKKPMHFIDIANRISENGFDMKAVNIQAVHNELIRSNTFVLMGRGTYALKEWGYEPGTVADVIERYLQDKGEATQDEIITAVLKQRQVKKITIILNLKNNDKFIRTGRNAYKLS